MKIETLKRGTTKCPNDKTTLLNWRIYGGMRLVTEIIPPKPKHPYYAYETECPECYEHFMVKK